MGNSVQSWADFMGRKDCGFGEGAVEPKQLSSEIGNNENTPHSPFPPTSQHLISTAFTLLIPKYFDINSSEVTAGFLSATNRWQPRRVLFPSCQLGGRLTCCHLKHRSRTPARRRLPSTTKILPGCPLMSILKSMGGSLITTPLINKHREGPHRGLM